MYLANLNPIRKILNQVKERRAHLWELFPPISEKHHLILDPACLYSQARSQGGVGGVVRPPPVAHPKDFVPPFSNFVPPFSNFVPPFSNFVPPFSNFVPPFSNFVPPFSNFVPPFSNFVPPFSNFVPPSAILFHPWTWNMWMTSHGQCPRGGCL